MTINNNQEFLIQLFDNEIQKKIVEILETSDSDEEKIEKIIYYMAGEKNDRI